MFSEAFAHQGGVDYVTVDGTKGRLPFSAPRRSPWTAALATRVYAGPGSVQLR